MGASGAERHALRVGEREQAPTAVALALERVVDVASNAGDDLDLRGDQLAGDVLVQDRVALREGPQLLEAWRQVECPRE